MKNLLRFALKVNSITDEEFAQAEALAHDQLQYMQPLKPATSARMRALGLHNQAVIAKLRELREIVRAGKDIGLTRNQSATPPAIVVRVQPWP